MISGIVTHSHFLLPALLLKLDLNGLGGRRLLLLAVLVRADLVLHLFLADGANGLVQREAEVHFDDALRRDGLDNALRLKGRSANVGGQDFILKYLRSFGQCPIVSYLLSQVKLYL